MGVTSIILLLLSIAGRAQVAEPKQTVNRQRVSGKSPPSNS